MKQDLDNLATMFLTAQTIDERDFVYNLFKIGKIKKNKFKKVLILNALRLRKVGQANSFLEVKHIREYNDRIYSNLTLFLHGTFCIKSLYFNGKKFNRSKFINHNIPFESFISVKKKCQFKKTSTT